MENLSDEAIVVQWKHHPFCQVFCGLNEFQQKLLCHSTELVHFRKCIGKAGYEQIFQMSISLRLERALEEGVNIDTTVHEKIITYPTESKLAIKIINPLNKLAKVHRFQ